MAKTLADACAAMVYRLDRLFENKSFPHCDTLVSSYPFKLTVLLALRLPVACPMLADSFHSMTAHAHFIVQPSYMTCSLHCAAKLHDCRHPWHQLLVEAINEKLAVLHERVQFASGCPD